MGRYIDADKTIEYLNLMYDKQNDMDEPYNCAVLAMINHIKNKAPSIDLADYVPKDFHDKTCEAMAKRHQEEIADILERADADRPQGEWIDDEFLGQYRCSECDYYSVDEFDYCPNCGARMFVKDINVPNKKGADDE